MSYQTFPELDSQIDRLLSAEKHDQALELLNQALVRLPQDRGDILTNRALLYCRMDRPHEALTDIQTLLEMKVSCPLNWRAFQALQTLPGYEDIKRANDEIIRQEQATASMQYKIIRPDGVDESTSTPLMLVLHGDGGLANLKQFPQVWPADPVTSLGVTVAYVQSSQVLFTNNHGWLPDPAVARRDVQYAYKSLSEQVAIDPSRVIISGFSGGATTSMVLAFSEAIPACGFIALSPAPWIPEGVDESRVRKAAERGMAGVILEGELLLPIESETQMCEMFASAGMRHQLVINPGVGHEYPEDLGERLAQAVEFILSRS